MAEQRRAARAAWKGSGDKASDELWFDLVEEKGGTEFVGYTSEQGEGEIIAIVRDGARRSEEHTSELQSLMRISYAVFCLKKKRMQQHDKATLHQISTKYSITSM